MDSFIHLRHRRGGAGCGRMRACPRARRWDDELATRIACVIGSGIGGLPLIENTHAD
jgi:3-oxoacyl-[acyl-carrier-protein] synthase II